MKINHMLIALGPVFIAGCADTQAPTLHRTIVVTAYRIDDLQYGFESAMKEEKKTSDGESSKVVSFPSVICSSGNEFAVSATAYSASAKGRKDEDRLINDPGASGVSLRGTVTKISATKAHVEIGNLISREERPPAFTLKWTGDVEVGKATVIFDKTDVTP